MKLKIVEYTPKKERNIMGEWIEGPTVYCIYKETGFLRRKKTYLKYTQTWICDSGVWEDIKKWKAPIYVTFVNNIDYALKLPSKEDAIELLHDIEKNPNKYILSE